MKKKILMVCYGGGHVKIVAPLYQRWSEEYDITVIALTIAGPYLDKLGIPYSSFKDLKDLLTADVLTLGRELAEVNEWVDIDESVAYLGLSMADLIQTAGSKEKAFELYQKFGRAIFKPISAMSHIFDLFEPDLLLTTSSPRAERTSLVVARQRCIPSICILDLFWTLEIKAVAQPGYADFVCVLSEEVKREAIRYGADPSKVIVTGNPAFDPLKVILQQDAALPKRARDTKVVLYADHDLPCTLATFPGATADVDLGDKIREQLNVLAAEKGWEVYFRPHPGQNCDYSIYENIFVSTQKDDLHELLRKVDIVVTPVSTVGLEGRILGKRLITIENSIFRNEGSYADMGLSTGVFEVAHLVDTIKHEAIDLASYPLEVYPGLATENIGMLIKNIFAAHAELRCKMY